MENKRKVKFEMEVKFVEGIFKFNYVKVFLEKIS